MTSHEPELETDRVAARNFGEAARRAGIRRIVYLGGLATGDEVFSKHLKSRIETGQVLGESGVLVVEFRASVVVGSVTFLLAEFVEGPPGPALWHVFKHRVLRRERR